MFNEYYTNREKYIDSLKEAEKKRLLDQARKANQEFATQAAKYSDSMNPWPR